jgi:hypothetical protein
VKRVEEAAYLQGRNRKQGERCPLAEPIPKEWRDDEHTRQTKEQDAEGPSTGAQEHRRIKLHWARVWFIKVATVDNALHRAPT